MKGVKTLVTIVHVKMRCDNTCRCHILSFSDLSLEIFNKSCCGLKLLPLRSQKDFLLLYSSETSTLTKQRHKTTMPFSTLHPKSSSTHKNSALATQTEKSTNRGSKSFETQAKDSVPFTSILSSSLSNTSPLLHQHVNLPIKQQSATAVVSQKPLSKCQKMKQPKAVRVRVELQLSKCISNVSVLPQPLRSVTPALNKGPNSSMKAGAQGRQNDNMEHLSCNLKMTKIHLAEPDFLHAAGAGKKEPKEKEQEDVG